MPTPDGIATDIVGLPVALLVCWVSKSLVKNALTQKTLPFLEYSTQKLVPAVQLPQPWGEKVDPAILELSAFDIDGDSLVFSAVDGETTLSVDGDQLTIIPNHNFNGIVDLND